MKKSQYMIFILCVITICIVLGIFLSLPMKKQDNLSITFKDVEKVKLHEKVDPVSLIASTNSVNILYPKIDTETPGKKQFLYIAVGKNGEQKEFMKELQVVDPTPPVLLLKKENISIFIGDSFDPKDYIEKAYSSYDGQLDVKITGEYRTDKAGQYTITYKITDSSENQATKKLILIVKQKEEKKKETITENNDSSVQPSNENAQPPKTQEKAPSEQENPSVSTGQEWLFSNGESFDSAREKCTAAGSASGRSYQCNVIQDQNGIYIGYRLDLR